MSSARELAQLVGQDIVSSDPGDLRAHAFDHSADAFISLRAGAEFRRPSCVVRPNSVQQVAEVMSWADMTRTAVVPYGGGSGVCGSIVGLNDAIVVDVSRIDAIVDLDETSQLVTVQAGVLGARLAEWLEARGYTLGHEPQSVAISTVGGWIATQACGQLSARYGGIEDLIAGLEAVLPGGRVLRSKVAPRTATGPDVARLLVGSEGTLGIVTEATFRVARIPQQRVDVCLSFDHMTNGFHGCRALAQSDLRPTVVRLYDHDDAALAWRHHDDPPTRPVLLMSFDGTLAPERAERAVETCGGERADVDLVAHWWQHRNDAVDHYRELMQGKGLLGPHAVVDTMEVSATWSVALRLYQSMKEKLSAHADFVGCHMSHVYADGACLYLTLASVAADDADAQAKNARWWDVGMRACLDAGGSISHHHGIGRVKAPWLPEEVNGWWDVLVAVKRALDPNGIMNPGALGL